MLLSILIMILGCSAMVVGWWVILTTDLTRSTHRRDCLWGLTCFMLGLAIQSTLTMYWVIKIAQAVLASQP